MGNACVLLLFRAPGTILLLLMVTLTTLALLSASFAVVLLVIILQAVALCWLIVDLFCDDRRPQGERQRLSVPVCCILGSRAPAGRWSWKAM